MAYVLIGKRKREASVVLFLLSYCSVSWITLTIVRLLISSMLNPDVQFYCGNNRGLLEGTINGINMLLLSTLSALYYPGILVLLKVFLHSRPVFCGSHNNRFVFLIFSWKSGNTNKWYYSEGNVFSCLIHKHACRACLFALKYIWNHDELIELKDYYGGEGI